MDDFVLYDGGKNVEKATLSFMSLTTTKERTVPTKKSLSEFNVW